MQRLAILFLSYILSGCAPQAPAPIEFKSLGSSGAKHSDSSESYTSSASGIKKRQIVIEPESPKEEKTEKAPDKPFETTREVKEEPKTKEVIDTKALEDEMSDQDSNVESEDKPLKKEKEVGDIITPNEVDAKTNSHFAMPVKGEVISKFGQHYMGKKNNGINIAASAGSDVKAVADGVVIFSGEDPKFGNLIIIKHDSGDLFSAYAHMSDLKLHLQDKVTKSQVIGHVGQTGEASKPQLHFAIRKGKTPVDPMQYLQ